MKLIGSVASPYVRRVRLLFGDLDYKFEAIDVFSDKGQKVISKYSPTKRVPILVDGERVIWDSLLIAQYFSDEPIDVLTQKDLTLINEMTDAGIQLFQLRKFEVDTNDESPFSKNNLERISNVLNHFEKSNLDYFRIVEEWLYCTLDWFSFREVYDWKSNHPKLVAFMHEHEDDDLIKETDPRL